MDEIKLFEQQQIRSIWDEQKQEWFFSIIDIVSVLTQSANPSNYWKVLKSRLIKEGNQSVTNCNQLKMKSFKDGKYYKTDVANMRDIFRIIQSIPSPKAEPFKLWLAQVGQDRIDEIIDPELTIDRALETYISKGYTKEWINQRLQAIQVRKELTDAWQAHGVKGNEYAILTNEITKAWAGINTHEYKKLKGLTKENLRDNMSTLELVLNMLAEATTTELTHIEKPQGFDENRNIAKRGGNVAGKARQNIQAESGRSVISSQNATHFIQVIAETANITNKK
ncbi:phage antirepressor protein [Pasteurellaceae bacterium RH1A]|nr:phage antirepressor protein [Pasteurellaceae bacterium RH1A]